MTMCACGCGQELDFTKGRTKKKYLKGHSARVNNRGGLARKGKSSWNKGKPRTLEEKKNISKAIKEGKAKSTYRPTEEHKRKIRLAVLESIKKCKGQVSPRYNPDACKVIDEYGKLHGYNFQHAENGGEFYIKELGYWVDGYDKEKNTVIEYYESYHHDEKRERDVRRQKEIVEHLKCNFIILKDGYDITTRKDSISI
jgi:hypothetical protein